ncbi:MAG: TfpX/TfpZ family type IV pilin accessory protein [Rhodoferax sp.]|nr:TfpX/TfpZ family type IV pilin accessory protein [Rhodoferax sp.]
MQASTVSFWKDRFKASGIHLGLSLMIALLAGLLVFGIWYPYPYREISGGRELFFLVVTVDVILGPLITLAVFNRNKPWTELRRDLVVVALVQLSALGYGLWTVFVARPVHMVFEYDRFRVVHAVDVPLELLVRTPSEVDALPLTGPTLLALRPFRNDKEKMDATVAALQGVSLSARPDLWQPYAKSVPDVLLAAKPVSDLKFRFANRASEIDHVLSHAGPRPQAVVYLPLIARDSFWTVFLDPVTAQVVATMPLDSF